MEKHVRKWLDRPKGDIYPVSYTHLNTLYPGSRKNALEHLSCAQENGFWPMTTGCQIIIGDGLRGTDELEAVSYTHLDVYKRQPTRRAEPELFHKALIRC